MKQAQADDKAPSLAPLPAKITYVTEKNIPLKGKTKISAHALNTSSSTTYYIQAGSFSTEENANKLSSKLSGIATIAVAKVEMGEKIWWRVRLGPFQQEQTANEALGKVRATGLPDARVVHL